MQLPIATECLQQHDQHLKHRQNILNFAALSGLGLSRAHGHQLHSIPTRSFDILIKTPSRSLKFDFGLYAGNALKILSLKEYFLIM